MTAFDDWLAANPDVQSLRLAICDLNGRAIGKRMPRAGAAKARSARMPFSALNLDFKGQDIDDSPLVFATGDADGVLRPTPRGPVLMPWLSQPAALLPMTLHHDDGHPFSGDPRHALSAVVDRYAAKGWRVEAAFEMEFHLLSATSPEFSPMHAERPGGNTLSLTALDEVEGFFNDLYAGAEIMGLGIGDAISEAGSGQFEVTLAHTDPLEIADTAWLFRMLAEGLARKHGVTATFMPKPFADGPGTGLHVHFSLWHQNSDRNVFDSGETGSALLRHAVAGCLAAMPASTLIFAPFVNSYDRFVDEAYAPTAVAWGYENRTVALRIPGGAPKACRIEHRVAGGDANPYLLLAAILGAALNGIEDATDPPAPTTGNAYAADCPAIPPDLSSAIHAFEQSAQVRRFLPADLIRNFVMTKRQERALWPGLTPGEQRALTLSLV
ncbi:MAG: glutamine synthetase [Rhodobacteraceae bacterium]|nr:glutamine synthetase [Paracoccaceae bacterium]